MLLRIVNIAAITCMVVCGVSCYIALPCLACSAFRCGTIQAMANAADCLAAFVYVGSEDIERLYVWCSTVVALFFLAFGVSSTLGSTL